MEYVLADSVTLDNFRFPLEVDLLDYKSSGLGTIDPFFISSSLTIPFIDDVKVANVSTKVTYIESEYDLDTVVS